MLARRATEPAETTDGVRLDVQVNLESLHDLPTFAVDHTDGVGLLRTEFLYMERTQFPSEEEQFRLYRRVVEHMQGKFLDCHFPGDQGDLYKPEEPIGNLAWLGDEISDYEPEIQHKFPEVSPTEHGSVLGLIDTVNHEGIDAFEEVLVVDEEDRLRFRQVLVLRRESAEVIVQGGLAEGERVCFSRLDVAVDGQEGVDKAMVEGDGAPDLILLDMDLPVIDGWEAAL